MAKRFHALYYFFNEFGKTFICVNNRILEYNWLLTALIYGLIGCFGSKLSDLASPITNICNRTDQIGHLTEQQITIKHFMPLAYKF